MTNSLLEIKVRKDLNKWFGIFALFMSFNSILFFRTNISIVVFLLILFQFTPKFNFFSIEKPAQRIVLLIIIGILTSFWDTSTENLLHASKSIQVLPNYLYWMILVIILINLRFDLNWYIIARYLSIGLVFTLIIYFFRKGISLPFIKNNTPNSYSFILICFSAISVTYIGDKYNKTFALILLALLVLSVLVIERRAGTTLVLLSSLAALYLKRVKIQFMLPPIIVFVIMFILIQLSAVENIIYNQSPRIHELIYESEEITKTDQSYLTRRLMIERGLVIFEENPLTGIGLNNYANIKVVNTEGNFEGADLVLNKLEDEHVSAHNSYLLVLVEGGLLLLIPIVILFIFILYHFIIHYNKRTQIENAYFWSFIAVVIHLYFIAEIVNVYAWFLFGCVAAITTRVSDLKVNRAKK